jgi:hypothetical protein
MPDQTREIIGTFRDFLGYKINRQWVFDCIVIVFQHREFLFSFCILGFIAVLPTVDISSPIQLD